MHTGRGRAEPTGSRTNGDAVAGATSAREVETTTADGVRLRGLLWSVDAPRGVVVISHGFGEHASAYERIAVDLNRRVGVDVVGFDYRGHGRSPGARGVLRRYEELVDDLLAGIEWASRHRPGLTRFLLGHSNGGQVALRVAAARPRSVDGVIVSNPALRIKLRVPRWKILVGRALGKMVPTLTFASRIRPEVLTRDPVAAAAIRGDALRHARMGPTFFFGLVAGGARLIEQAERITTPTVFIIGGADAVVDPLAAREMFDRLGATDKQFWLFPSMLHDPLLEVGREHVVDDLTRWLDARLPAR